MFATAAGAQTDQQGENGDPDDWEFKLTPLYIWFAGLDGDASIGPVNAPINVSFSDVLENLDAIFTIHFEARKSRWTLITDGMWLQLKPEATLANGAPVGVTVRNQTIRSVA